MVAFADRIEHSWLATSLSIFCFAASLLTHASLLTEQLPAAAASMVVNEVRCILLAGTFILSGIPQVVEALCIAGGGDIDTHVLMSLAVVGTLYLGMAQEVRGLANLSSVSLHHMRGGFHTRYHTQNRGGKGFFFFLLFKWSE